jgi:RNA polymerase sigma-70 factor (ECF subfamily)
MTSRQKKEREFQKITEEFSSFIRSLVLRYNLNRLGIEPDDLIQEVRLKLWKIIDDEKNISSPASYIRKVVESAVIDQIRKIRKEEEVFISEKQKLISEFEPRGSSYQDQAGSLKEYVLKAADRLLDSRKLVVKLYLLNMSLPEISAYLNYSPAKTRNLLYRGLADLKIILKEIGFNHEKTRRQNKKNI